MREVQTIVSERILIVEDDESILAGLTLNLEMEGYQPIQAKDGQEGVDKFVSEAPDLVIVDIMLPKRNGFEVLDAIRASDATVPVLILSARDRKDDKVLGLELGADDYITKPFDIAELLARINAALRRKRLDGAPNPTQIEFGPTTIDTVARRVATGGEEVDMTTREYDLLLYLVRSNGRVVTRQQILDQVWGQDYEGTERTVDNFVARLRNKLEANPEKPAHIQTVRGVGYRFERVVTES